MDLNEIRKDLENFWKTNDIDGCRNIQLLKKETSFIPFIGAGISVDFGFPTWKGFLSEIIREKNISQEEKDELDKMLKAGEYLKLAQKLNSENTLLEKVRNVFGKKIEKKEINETNYFYYLRELKKKRKINQVVTTNFDKLIEEHFKFDNIYMPKTMTYCQNITMSIDDGKKILIKLHGTCDDNTSIILTSSDFNAAYSQRKKTPVVRVVEYIWKHKHLLFIGCGFQKDYLIDRIGKIAIEGDRWHYAILPYSEEMKAQVENMHIRPIWFQPYKYGQIFVILKMILGKDDDSNKKESEKSVFAANTNSKQTSEQFDDKKYIDKLASKVESNKDLQNKLIDAIFLQQRTTKLSEFSGSGSILERIYDHIITCVRKGQKYPLLIKGDPGTGKSIILSLIYYKCKKDNENGVQPFIINTEYYDNKEIKIASQDLENELSKIQEQLDLNKKFIVFVEGINQYKMEDDSLERIVNKWISRCNNNVSFVLSITTLNDRSYPRIKSDRVENQFFRKLNEVDDIKSICLYPVENGSKYFKKLVDQTITCCEKNLNKKNTSTQDKFFNYIERIGVRYIDFRTVYLVVKNCDTAKNFETKDLCSLFKNYCFDKIDDKENNEKILLDTAEYIAKSWRGKKHDHKSEKIYYLYKAESIRNYLFAYYYINILEANKIDELKEFKFILPQGVNTFLVGLMNSRKDGGKKIIDNISCLMKNNDISLTQKTQFAFMLGRVQEARDLAKRILDKEWDSIDWTKKLSEADGERIRTIGISRIYLGDWPLENDFYNKLIYNGCLNDVNRTFHIRYYLTDSYRFENNFNICDIECTDENVDSLCNLLYHSIFKTESPLLYVNIITLLSLTVYKLFCLNKGNKEKALELIEKLKEKLDLIPSIKSYVDDVKNLIGKDLLTRFTEIYKLKKVKREGWIKRKVQSERIESVAEHTWASCQLALIFLQEDLDSCSFVSKAEKSKYKQEFSLSKIIQMLVVHDLGEAYTGDKISTSKKECDDINERNEIHNNLAMLDIVPYFSTFRYIERLFNEFTELKTYNAKLAKDIDAIEPLIQVYVYRDYLKNWFPEYEKWKNKLKLNTEFGQNLLKFLNNQLSKENH